MKAVLGYVLAIAVACPVLPAVVEAHARPDAAARHPGQDPAHVEAAEIGHLAGQTQGLKVENFDHAFSDSGVVRIETRSAPERQPASERPGISPFSRPNRFAPSPSRC